jgi:NAD-dependent dihydropyrimidine dehydrogenase PreA subunit
MAKRKIVEINEEKCNGCGECIPDCPEGALQIIDGKARLVSDLLCDGLGACLGTCPQDAISVVEREAEPYSERKVMEQIVKKGDNTIKAHLQHLKEHGETDYLNEAIEFLKEKGIDNPLEGMVEPLQCGCPGSKMMDLRDKKSSGEPGARQESELRQWPVQLMLVNPNASYFKGADLLVAADCVPPAYSNFHQDFLKGKILTMGCPKQKDAKDYMEKLTDILKMNDIKSVTVLHMEVPCCYGLRNIVMGAVEASGKEITPEKFIIGVDGRSKKIYD